MSWKDKNAEMRGQLRSLNACVPDAAKGFGALSKAAKAPKALDEKTVEFVALAISVAERCEPCIAFHAEALVRLGATRDEIGDLLAMCIQMGGGPSLMYAAKALDCFDELSGAAG
ncbi:MAG: carboxymuconolactone decarboxylase family protein [Rhodobacteraceae bacterium]|nr:carboxymuconolactone decarboxylase family protein [Paracoccaceae bacterium]